MVVERFPFGQVSARRPPRRPEGQARGFVLGVYPSAFHVRWMLPKWFTDERRAASASAERPATLGSFAVDVEPVVFWDGRSPSVSFDEWARRVDFAHGDEWPAWGTLHAGANNGSSGKDLDEMVRALFGGEPDQLWWTDAVPRFFVKRAPGSREQGNLIDDDFHPFVRRLDGKARAPIASTLPPRPPIARLVSLATTDERERLRAELVLSKAPLVVTLGEEARKVVVGVADSVKGPPCKELSLRDLDGYGQPGTLQIGEATFELVSIVHPGNRSNAEWNAAREAWMRDVAPTFVVRT